MGNKNGAVMQRKKSRYITDCITCEFRYTHFGFFSERRGGVTFKHGKTYCLFPKKPIKLDGRKRNIAIPDDCPRYGVPPRFTVYRLKKRVPVADATSGNALRYWRVYTGNIEMVTLMHLFGGGSYTVPETKENKLWYEGEPVHNLEKHDIVVREDGFTIKSWEWNGDYILPLLDFDEKGIRKIPKQMSNP